MAAEVGALAVVVEDGDAKVLFATADGAETYPVQRAGKKRALRFAVGEPGRRGTIWRLWANRDHDDVYLASRHTAGEVKWSLHESGDWRHQVVESDRQKSVHLSSLHETDGRILHRWTRPSPNKIGWTHGLTIVLPERHLVPLPIDEERSDDVRWWPSPKPGEQAEFELSIVKPQLGYVSLTADSPRVAIMDALQLTGGEVAIVTAMNVPTDPGEARFIARAEVLLRPDQAPPEDVFSRSADLGPRLLVRAGYDASNGNDAHQERPKLPRYYDLAYGTVT